MCVAQFSHSRRFMGGRQPYEVLKLHEKYGMSTRGHDIPGRQADSEKPGPVVRIAPNELSFNTSQAWRDIYAARKGHLPFIKSEFYEGGNFASETLSIVSERNPQRHARMRKYLANAFSDRSLGDQEPLIQEVVDQLMTKSTEHGSKPEGTNMVMWFNLATFHVCWPCHSAVVTSYSDPHHRSLVALPSGRLLGALPQVSMAVATIYGS